MQVAFLDHGIRPNGLHDLVLGHEFTRSFHEEEENVSRSQPQRDRYLRAVLRNAHQFAGRQLQSELVENQRPGYQELAPIRPNINATFSAPPDGRPRTRVLPKIK